MASSWIKVRSNLLSQREVLIVAKRLAIPPTHAMGLCVALWAWADENTADGVLDGVGPSEIDDVVRHPGFSEALRAAGWIVWDDRGVIIPNHDRHNGKCAKQRALSGLRMAAKRGRENVTAGA